jgi:hypothetical protein
MRTGKFLMCIWLMLGVTGIVGAQSSYSIPRFAVTFDFNTSFSTENAWGPRMQIYSNNNYFGKDRNRKKRLTENTIAYTYGLGFGGYKVNSLKKKNGSDDGLYLFFTSVALCYQNQGMFEPFAGIYPGISWGIKSEFFVNPVAGINIIAFRVRRNWNSLLFQTYAQARIEYNTMLSTTFIGCGVILQIM